MVWYCSPTLCSQGFCAAVCQATENDRLETGHLALALPARTTLLCTFALGTYCLTLFARQRRAGSLRGRVCVIPNFTFATLTAVFRKRRLIPAKAAVPKHPHFLLYSGFPCTPHKPGRSPHRHLDDPKAAFSTKIPLYNWMHDIARQALFVCAVFLFTSEFCPSSAPLGDKFRGTQA